MRNIMKFTLIIILLTLFTYPLMAQVGVEKTAQTAMKFLSVPIGARGAGMGDAFTAVCEGAEAMFWNPAGMARINKWDISGGYNQWLADIKHWHFDAVYNAQLIGVFGINVMYVDYGVFYSTIRSETDPSGYIDMGELKPVALAAGVAYSKQVSDRFSFGVNLKYIRQDFGDAYVGEVDDYDTVSNEYNTFAFDFGVLYYTGIKDLRIGVSAQHISQELEYIEDEYPLPYIIKIGLAMDLLKAFGMENPSHSLTLAIDASHPRDFTERLHFGLEYWLYDMIALRAGYKINYDEDNVSLGVGIREKITGMKVDYAYNPFGNFNAIHRISVGVGF
jgi:hypothetical protein